MDAHGRAAQRHLCRVAGRHDLDLGHRCRLRHGTQLRRGRSRWRSVRFPALAELSGDFAPGGSWLGVRALGLALRAGDGRGPSTLLSSRVPAHFDHADAEAVLTAVYTGTLPYGRLFELARVLLDA